MAIINQRWPSDLMPERCDFGPSRNDAALVAPYTRQITVVKRGRRLWTAKLSWRYPNNATLAKLRYYLEALDGFAGSVQLWDFSAPVPAGVDFAGAAGGGSSTTIPWTYSGITETFLFGGSPSFWGISSAITAGASAAVGATSILLTGLVPSKIAVVQGQFVQIGRRLYIADATVSSNGSGNATITLTSGLVSAVVTGDVVRLTQAGCEMRLENIDWQHTATAGDGFVGVSASFIETVTDYS